MSVDRLTQRVEELETAIRDELIRRTLTSLPLKIEFGKKNGMSLDEVDDWMIRVSRRLKELVR